MKFINFVEQHRKTILHIIIAIIFIITLVIGFKSGFLNKNSQVTETLYGYASALNHAQFPDKNSFFIQDLSISEKPENHPYPYIHNADLGFVLNRFIMALGISVENSYVYANAFTAIVRVASLYLLYFLLLDVTGSSLFAVLAVILIGSDYYNFYNTHYSVLRGNSFVAYVLFLFSTVRLSGCEKTKERLYIFLSIISLWMSFLIGFMTTSTLILTMIFLLLFRVIRISADQFAKNILFGVAIPFMFRIVTAIWSVGLENWVIDDWLTKGSKMIKMSKTENIPADLNYIFYDANLIANYTSFPLTISDVIMFFSKYSKALLYYFTITMDSSAIILLIVFLLWAISYYIICWRKGNHSAAFSFTAYFLVAAFLVIVLNMFIFPTYYHWFELVYSQYIGLLFFTLPVAYFLSRNILLMITHPNKTNIALCIAIICLIVFARMQSNYLFYRFMHVEKEMMFEVLKPYKGKSSVTNTPKHFIYSKILGRPSTYHYFNIYIDLYYESNPKIYEFNPFPIGTTWKVQSPDVFKNYEYSFPDLTIFNLSIYEMWIYDSFIKEDYSFANLFKIKSELQTKQKYQIKVDGYFNKILKIYGDQRVLYHDNDFVIINNNFLSTPDEMIRRRYIWDNLVSIQKKCFEGFINIEYEKEKYQSLVECLQSKVANRLHLEGRDDFYTKMYSEYNEVIKTMYTPSVAREKLLDHFKKSRYIKAPLLLEGDMSFGQMVLAALVNSYQQDDILTMIAVFEGYYPLMPLQLRKYALALRVLAMEREPVRDIWKYKLYKKLYKKMLQNSSKI